MRFPSVVLGAVLAIVAIAGCSSAPSPDPLMSAAGTAEVTMNDKNLPMSKNVDCTFIQSTTTIVTGDADSGSTLVVDNSHGLTARSVSIRNLGGFTGSYWQDLGNAAEVTQTGRAYKITGTAEGFNADNPSSRTTGTFSIDANC